MSDLAELRRRVSEATGPDRIIDCHIWDAFFPGTVGVPLYTSSIDAALALVERLLPGWRWYLADSDRSGGKPVASVFAPDEIVRTGRIPRSECATPALAVLLALLDALHADGRAA